MQQPRVTQVRRVVDRVTIMHRTMRALLAILVFATAAAVGAAVNNYAERRDADVKRCAAIDTAAYQTGLAFNPDGYRSYYERSKCLQDAAIRYRDGSLCSDVRERRDRLFSSWGYSASRCRARVAEETAKDIAAVEELKRQYVRGHVTLTDFRIELNGNGRDFDVLPLFGGTHPAGYTFTLDVVQPGTSPVTLLSSGNYMEPDSHLNLFARRVEFDRLIPGGIQSHPHTIRATLTLALPVAPSVDGAWSDAFLERTFPARDRSQSMTKVMAFPAASR